MNNKWDVDFVFFVVFVVGGGVFLFGGNSMSFPSFIVCFICFEHFLITNIRCWCTEIKDYKSKEQTVCFMEVDHLCKLEAIAQIKETLRPSNIHLAVDRFDEKPVDFQIRVKEMAGANLQFAVKDGCTIFNCTTKYTGGKGLLIVVDATMPKQSYGNYLDCFTIILVCPGERPSLDQSIKELSALSYVYFNGGK